MSFCDPFRVGALACAGALLLSLPGCAATGLTEKDFEKAVASWAGQGARDCGKGLLEHAGRAVALQCAQDALREGRAFFVIVQVQGIDSRLYQGLSSRGTRDSRLFWFDSDIGGGGSAVAEARLTDRACTDPVLTEEEQPIDCQ